MTAPAAPGGAEQAWPAPAAGSCASWLTPVNLVIAAVTVLALGLRLFYLTRPGYLLGVTEYDDGSYFGSAVRLVHGVLPYRDFVFVQPPGITLLMAPAALVSRVIGTDGGIAIARVLTMLAGAAGVAMTGLLVRHRGVLAALIACGVVAVYPDSVSSSHTLARRAVAGVVLHGRSGDGVRRRPDHRQRPEADHGAAPPSGSAALSRHGRSFRYLSSPCSASGGYGGLRCTWAGVAAGFLIPVLPFAALAPHSFYDSVITAQVGGRVHAARMPLWYRLRQMSGFANEPHVRHLYIAGLLALIVVFVIVACALALLLTRRLPPPIEWFAYGSTVAVVGIFLWPAQFHYHFSGFLAPFLGLSVALPAAGCWPRSWTGSSPGAGVRRSAGPAPPDPAMPPRPGWHQTG